MASVDGLRVRAERVVEDSRCPADADCVWAGRMIVQATVFGGGWSRHFDLEMDTPVSVADGSLALVSATPLRRTGSRISASAYRFTFVFQGGR